MDSCCSRTLHALIHPLQQLEPCMPDGLHAAPGIRVEAGGCPALSLLTSHALVPASAAPSYAHARIFAASELGMWAAHGTHSMCTWTADGCSLGTLGSVARLPAPSSALCLTPARQRLLTAPAVPAPATNSLSLPVPLALPAQLQVCPASCCNPACSRSSLQRLVLAAAQRTDRLGSSLLQKTC